MVAGGGLVRLCAVVLVLLLLPALFGWLDPLEQGLRGAMAERPLPRLYMPVFIGIGALVPLAIRVIRRREREARLVLDPYLVLLLAQLISELLVVLAGGKGLGVLVGMTYTLLRLLQLRLLWLKADTTSGLRLLLLLLTALWSWNAIQILLWRWWPLVALNAVQGRG